MVNNYKDVVVSEKEKDLIKEILAEVKKSR